MTLAGWIFMLTSWAFVIGMLAYCFIKIFRK